VIRLLRAADRTAVPWKNGGGVTREVAASPPSAGLDSFDWRVSIAEVRASGPFSVFEGIDRTLTVLQGRLALTFADRTVELTADGARFAFPGDVPCTGQPVGGPVTDLNVMVRRGRRSAHVERVTEGVIAPETTMLVVASASTGIQWGDRHMALAPFDAVLIVAPEETPFSLRGDACIIRIRS